MSIDLKQEKECKLSTQNVYDIISFAVQAADDNGFVNSFIFNRALYIFAAIILYPEIKEKYAAKASTSIPEAWTSLLEEGIVDNLVKDYKPELDILAHEGSIWLDEYTQYAQSARGVLDVAQTISGDIVREAAQQLKQSAEESGVDNVLEIADKWGMNNEIGKEQPQENQESVSENSVFE